MTHAKPEPKILSADDILGACDRRIEPVDVPEWGGRVYVRTLSGADLDAYDAARIDDEGKPVLVNFRARYVAYTCCDAAGKLLFTPEQVESLGKKAAPPLNRVLAAARALNGDGPEALAAAKKGSSGAPSGASPTASS